MPRVTVVIPVLVLGFIGLLSAGQTTTGVGAQDATPATAAHPLVGSWVIEETFRAQNAVAGTPPPEPWTKKVATATFFADGNALVSYARAGQPPMQGAWSATGERSGTFTVIGFALGGDGVAYGGLERYRATVEVDATGHAFAGGYTYELIEPDNPSGPVAFTWHSWWSGTRIDVAPPDPVALTLGPGTPVATPAAAAETGSVTVRLLSCPADLALTADQAGLLAACDPFASPAVAPQLLIVADDGELWEPTPGTEVDPGVYRWTELPFGGYFVHGPQDPRLAVAQFDSFMATTAAGHAVQNPYLAIDATTPEAELNYFYFFRDGPETGPPSPTN
jgi:hypothetical protein